MSATEDATISDAWSDGSRHAMAVMAAKPGAVLQLSQYAFPGWKISTRSGPAQAQLDTDADGMLRVHLPSSGQYQLELAYAGST